MSGLVRTRDSAGSGSDLLELDEIAERCGLHPDLLRRFVDLGLIEPASGSGPERFPAEVTIRIQRAVRLRRDLGINTNGVLVVLDLLERIDLLEARLRALETSNRTR